MTWRGWRAWIRSATVERGRFPVGGQQRFDLRDPEPWEPSEHVGEVRLRIDAAAPAAHDHGVDDGTAPAGIRMADEEPALPPHGRRANGILDEVVVDLEAAIAEIPDQRLVLINEVPQGLPMVLLGRKLGRTSTAWVFNASQIASACS